MSRFLALTLILLCFGEILSFGHVPAAQGKPPLRVGIIGLVHGHVHGFFQSSAKSPAIQIVGIAEPDAQLLSAAGAKYGIDRSQLFSSLEEMIAKAHPQAVLAYTDTFDHRKVVEICA